MERIKNLKKLNSQLISLLPKIQEIREEMNYICSSIRFDKYFYGWTPYLKEKEKEFNKFMRKHNKLLQNYSKINQERKKFRIITKSKQFDLFI